jgi:hypothetical protein
VAVIWCCRAKALGSRRRLLDLGQDGAPRPGRPHRLVGGRVALAPLRHGLQAVAGGQGSGAFLRRLELGSNTRRRAACAMKTSCQSASSP